MNKKEIKPENKFSFLSSFSGGASILSSYQVCHNVCMGLIGLLSLIGITLVGMPLAFLLPYTVPFWVIGTALLVITFFIYFKKPKCMSRNLLIFNTGIIIAAIPFKEVQEFQPFFWVSGGIIILIAVYNFLNKKILKKFINKNI